MLTSKEHDHGHGHGHGREEGHGHSRELDIEEEEMVLHRNDFKSAAQATTVSHSSSHHEHKHNIAKPSRSGRDLGMLGVLIHVVGDAINNIGVIISAVVIWKAEGEGRYYIDPAISVFIAIMIFLTAIPLTKRSGTTNRVYPGIPCADKSPQIPGVDSVHELHIWRLDQHKSVATAHVVVDDRTVENFGEKAKVIMECLHAYGIHSVTLQPEVLPPCDNETTIVRSVYTDGGPAQVKKRVRQRCQLVCGKLCDRMRCCATVSAS
ncbi:Cd2+/Zn2+ transporter protein [Purpureocillium lilacinum]|uniref:Cd2+/Zn2+ transporter protein n=1 Tax=Purpureocillium lilacinum TaxID=33203 RepID=A0A179I092_PURLI|nr:Cd2+/Zn2+ transporter protein [Purpureocillium lilacinum]OAQ95020.1 Cd2+/Zn2+ transporter protein [Purpureocillium lilacinum]